MSLNLATTSTGTHTHLAATATFWSERAQTLCRARAATIHHPDTQPTDMPLCPTCHERALQRITRDLAKIHRAVNGPGTNLDHDLDATINGISIPPPAAARHRLHQTLAPYLR